MYFLAGRYHHTAVRTVHPFCTDARWAGRRQVLAEIGIDTQGKLAAKGAPAGPPGAPARPARVLTRAAPRPAHPSAVVLSARQSSRCRRRLLQ